MLSSDREAPPRRRESSAMHTTKRPSNYERHRAAPDLVSEALGAYVASFCNIICIAESGGSANIPLARKCITSTAQPLTEPHIHQTFPTSAHRNMARVAWFPRSTPAASWPRPGVQACVESWCMERGETSPRAQERQCLLRSRRSLVV